MVQLLAALVGIGIIASFFTGPIALAITIPAGIALFLVLRARQPEQKVDPRYLGGAQPDQPGVQSNPDHPST